MPLKNLDLIGAIFIVAINVGWTQVPNHLLVIGIIFALPLIFILPGYTFTQTLFRKRSSAPDSSSNLILRPSLKIGQPVNAADHIIFSLGLSMAIDVVVGFALNVLPIGLQALSWTLSLGLITTVFALLAAFLRRKDIMKVARIPRPRLTIYECLLFGLAILVAAAAVWFSVIRPPATQADFTQFWMLPSNETANSCAVRIGVQNHESTTVEYRVVVTVNGSVLGIWSSVVLAPQAEWDQFVSLPLRTANTTHIEGQLYQSNKPATVYRKVDLTLHFLSNSKDGKVLQCGTT
ncbi:MAG TPA: DUF1616 domain-containing protein [Methylomirabilota bacterium]|nr:DUF1616 domain-containing protein [Methylomirabilota bacterium]